MYNLRVKKHLRNLCDEFLDSSMVHTLYMILLINGIINYITVLSAKS
jgi:hypothetical protein